MRGNGRVLVSQNPMEEVGAALSNIASMKGQQKALLQQKALIDELRKSRAAYGRNVMGMDGGMPQPDMYQNAG
jgi:hypothetical protein